MSDEETVINELLKAAKEQRSYGFLSVATACEEVATLIGKRHMTPFECDEAARRATCRGDWSAARAWSIAVDLFTKQGCSVRYDPLSSGMPWP